MKIPGTGQPVLRLQKGAPPEAGSLKIPRQTLAETTDWRRTETTRYLCAAAHLDFTFRDHAIRTLVKEKHRAVAISFGVDLATVLRHCLVARSRKRIRNWMIAVGITLSYVAFGVFSAVFGPVVAPFLAGVVYFLIAWSAILAEQLITHHNTVRLNLTRDNFNPDCVSFSGKLPDLPDVRSSNAMIYSGFSPFVGTGTNLGGWSVAVDASKGKQELGRTAQPEPFEIRDLYLEVCSAIARLGLSGVAVEDKLCVNGQDIRGDQRFLPDLMGRPKTLVDQSVMDNVRDNPTASVRHYKQIRVVDWRGELVFSMFVRFAKAGRSLFVESSSCLLTPVHERYQKKLDAMNPNPGIVDSVKLGVNSLAFAALSGVLWPIWLFAKLTGLSATWEHRIKIRRTIRKACWNLTKYTRAGRRLRRTARLLFWRGCIWIMKEESVKLIPPCGSTPVPQ